MAVGRYLQPMEQYNTSPYTEALAALQSMPVQGQVDAPQLLQLFDQYRQALAAASGMPPTQYRIDLGKSSVPKVSGSEGVARNAPVTAKPPSVGEIISGGEGGHGGPEGFTEGLAGQFGTPDYQDMSATDLNVMQGALGFFGLGDLAGIVGTALSAAKGIQNGLPPATAIQNALIPGNHLNTGIGTSFGPAGMSAGGFGGNYAGGSVDAQSADAQTNAGGWAGFGAEQQAADNPDGWAGIAGEVAGAMGGESSGDGGYGDSLGDFGGPDGGWI